MPVVLSATVLPPVLGPLMTRRRSSPPRLSDIGMIGAIFAAEFVFEDGMARGVEAEFVGFGEFRRGRVEILSESRAGEGAVEFGDGFGGGDERRAHRLEAFGEVRRMRTISAASSSAS